MSKITSKETEELKNRFAPFLKGPKEITFMNQSSCLIGHISESLAVLAAAQTYGLDDKVQPTKANLKEKLGNLKHNIEVLEKNFLND